MPLLNRSLHLCRHFILLSITLGSGRAFTTFGVAILSTHIPGDTKWLCQYIPTVAVRVRVTIMSVRVRLQHGEFDDQLQWPFNGQITVEMYNCTTNTWTASTVIDLTKDLGDEYVSRPKMFWNRSIGHDKYISQSELQRHYLIKNGVSMRVAGVELLAKRNSKALAI